MKWPRLRTVVIVGLLAAGTILVSLGWHEKRGYVDAVATGTRATEEGRFDSRDFERAERNLFASKDLLAYDRGVRAYAAGQAALAARYFRDVISQSQSPALRAKAHYNLGNLLALGGKASEAAEMYREALRLDPSDWDAKSNLETLYAQVQTSEEEGGNASLRQDREPGQSGNERGQGGGPGAEGAGI